MKGISESTDNRSGLKLRRIFKVAIIILPLAFAGNIIYTLLSSELNLLYSLLEFKVGLLLLALVLSLLPWFAQSVRIIIWSKVFARPVTFAQAYKAVLSSDIAAAATPTMLGGGYAKAGFLISYGFPAGEAAMITLLGTIEDAVFFLVALPAAIIWCRAWENPYVDAAWTNLLSNWPVVIAVIIILLIVLFFINKLGKAKSDHPVLDTGKSKLSLGTRLISNFRKFWLDFANAFKFAVSKGKKAFMLALVFTGIGWCSRYSAISALVLGLGLKADPVLFFLLQWVVFTTMTMIPTPGAIGGAEVSFALIYNGLIPSFAIPAVTSGWRFFTFYLPVGMGSLIFSLLGGADLLDRKKTSLSSREEAEAAVCSESTGK